LITAIKEDKKSILQSPAAAVRDSLLIMESMDRYNHWIYSNMRRYIGADILEVGSGTGNITQFLVFCRRVVALESDPVSAARAQGRFRHNGNIEIIQSTLQEYAHRQPNPDLFDTVLSINVLEHIEDDVEALRCMRKLTNAQGRVVIMAPALPILYGSLDRSFGHFRRYRRRRLQRRFHDAGLEVIRSFYMNLPGVLGWFVHSRLLRRRQIDAKTSRRFNKAVPWLRTAESIVKPPLGQSLIMVGKKA